MEIKEVFQIIKKRLDDFNTDQGFKLESEENDSIIFSGKKGAYKITFFNENSVFTLECAYDKGQDGYEFNTICRSLFELDSYDERDAKSISNEFSDELEKLFKVKKKVDLDKVKMPKAVSRRQAKNGIISYDVDSLANRFGVIFPDLKDEIKKNIAKYGEFLPETFFQEFGTPRVLQVISSGNKEEIKRLFKMLNDVYEDGTNEVQDIIGVTILGEMKGDPELMAVADEYMIEYMAGPVHEINKLTKKKSSLTKKLANPPAYKPKKNKSPMQSILAQGANK